MKKFTLSVAAVMAMGTLAIAGGDITPVVEPVVEVAAPVADNSGFYAGIGAASLRFGWDDFETTDTDFRYSVYGVNLLAGYQFNQYVAVEGRYTMNVEDWFDENVDSTNIGLYVKPMYAVNDVFTVYGLLGYGQLKFEDDYDSSSDSGFQWGIGASATVTDNISAFVDYTRLWDDNEFDGDEWDEGGDFVFDVITVGLTYKF